ncbi:MAG: AAA family ATPase, partial [Alphaproteobacteria bacterium]|nr:AAA family ATPase [Alphaproteobacteria bacterium]
MSKLLIGTGFNSKANDERIAATILTCLYPDKYTFYKHDDVYINLCKYLGEDTQKTGLCYSHFLSLLTPLTKIVSTDSELQKLVNPMLEGQHQSNLLIAQDIVWMIIRSLPQRLGYINDILYNKNKEMNTTDNISKYIELLETNKNLILTGAPGTGKTYMSKAIAKKMGAEVGFVQFHPSYDYTDFVEGLRPIKFEKNENIGFKREDGVFKKFCKIALQNKIDSEKSKEEFEKEKSLRKNFEDFISDSINECKVFRTDRTNNEFSIMEINDKYISIS